MHRRTFLHVAGASSLLALVPFSPVIPTSRARRDRDPAPLPGLSRCQECGEWRGDVIDDGVPKTATCRCEPSRCSRCGGIVHPRRICGHYWCAESEALVHVPWFVGMAHTCDS